MQTANADSRAARERASALEQRIAEHNREIAALGSQEPTSERELAKLNASREWADLQRAKLVQERVDLEGAILAEIHAELVALQKQGDVDFAPLLKEKAELEQRLRAIEDELNRLRWQSGERMRSTNEARARADRFKDPRYAEQRHREIAALRDRLLAL